MRRKDIYLSLRFQCEVYPPNTAIRQDSVERDPPVPPSVMNTIAEIVHDLEAIQGYVFEPDRYHSRSFNNGDFFDLGPQLTLVADVCTGGVEAKVVICEPEG